MKHAYKIDNLGCANCAAKMEHDIAHLTNVNLAKINFMTSRLILDAEESCYPDLLEKAQKIVQKYEPDARILF